MKDIKEYIWAIILISGIMLIISIFTPISQYIQPGSVSFRWLWGLSYYNFEGFGSELNFWLFSNTHFIAILWDIIDLLLSLIIFIGSLVLIIIGSRLRLRGVNIKDKENKLVKIGILMILVPLIYVITSYILGNIYYDYMDFGGTYELWPGARTPGFAFIGPFIGGALILISGIVSKTKISREEVTFTQEKGDIITKTSSQPMAYRTLNSISSTPSNTKYIWIIGLTGGILTLISFLTPAFYVNVGIVEEYFWMWGLHYGVVSGYGSAFAFIPTQSPSSYMIPIFLSGIIPAILILSSSIKLIAITNSIRKGRNDIKTAENKLVGWGIALIVASIIFLIGINVTMNALFEYILYDPYFPYYPIPGIWDVYDPGFAVIGPFLGGALAIISGIASKTIKPREEPFITKDFKKHITKIPTEVTVGQINFCPDCGKRILNEESRFCTNCGFEINLVM